MNPRTKLQRHVYSLSATLPNLDNELKPWAFEKCIDHIGYRTKKATSCLSCGHQWQGHPTSKKEKCPGCERILSLTTTRKKLLTQMVYFAKIDVFEGYQLNRYFQMYTYHKSGTEARIFIWEVVQQWMQPNGKHAVVAKNRGGMGYYMSDNFHGNLEIRDASLLRSKYNLFPSFVHPKFKCLPIYKRNGFNGKIGISTPYEIFNQILTDSKAETLLKAKQYALLDALISGRWSSVNRHWNSIKICMRSNYVVKNAVTYLDYLDLLCYFGKDLRSPVYVCPVELKKSHDKLVAKKQEQEKQLRLKRLLSKIETDQAAYIDSKGAFFGLAFSNAVLTIKVLESVREFFEEGDAHKHCVFTNEYYKKEDSLIFSAQVGGVSVETIEVSLPEMKIVQSRGLQNKATVYHEEIISLMKKNLRKIKKKYNSIKDIAA